MSEEVVNTDDKLRLQVHGVVASAAAGFITSVQAKDEIMQLIRNEKLKLLAEVRERVVGEDVTVPSFEIPIYESEFVITSFTQQNDLRAGQRITLDKLEAEL